MATNFFASLEISDTMIYGAVGVLVTLIVFFYNSNVKLRNSQLDIFERLKNLEGIIKGCPIPDCPSKKIVSSANDINLLPEDLMTQPKFFKVIKPNHQSP